MGVVLNQGVFETISNYPVHFVANHIETNYFENFVVNYRRIEVVHDKSSRRSYS